MRFLKPVLEFGIESSPGGQAVPGWRSHGYTMIEATLVEGKEQAASSDFENSRKQGHRGCAEIRDPFWTVFG